MISMASDYIQPFSAGLTHSTLTNMSSSSLNFASGTNSYFTSTNQSDVYIASFDSCDEGREDYRAGKSREFARAERFLPPPL